MDLEFRSSHIKSYFLGCCRSIGPVWSVRPNWLQSYWNILGMKLKMSRLWWKMPLAARPQCWQLPVAISTPCRYLNSGSTVVMKIENHFLIIQKCKKVNFFQGFNQSLWSNFSTQRGCDLNGQMSWGAIADIPFRIHSGLLDDRLTDIFLEEKVYSLLVEMNNWLIFDSLKLISGNILTNFWCIRELILIDYWSNKIDLSHSLSFKLTPNRLISTDFLWVRSMLKILGAHPIT